MRRRTRKPRGVFVSGLNPQLWRAVRQHAKREGITLAALVSSALIQYLNAHKEEVHVTSGQ